MLIKYFVSFLVFFGLFMLYIRPFGMTCHKNESLFWVYDKKKDVASILSEDYSKAYNITDNSLCT